MKAKFLKIAGVKNESEFYKKYPTESAFFKAHPEAKELKKAKVGSYIGGEQDPSNIVSYSEYENLAPLQILGKTKEQMEKEEISQYAKQNAESMGNIMGSLQELSGSFKNIGVNPRKKINIKSSFDPKAAAMAGVPKTATRTSVLPGRKEGGKVKKAQTGVSAAAQSKDLLGGISQGLPLIGGIVNAIEGIGQMKQQRKELERAAKISDVALKASQTQPERTARRYTQQQVISPNEVFIPGGTTTEILAEYGASIGGNPTEIQNMYNPGDLYSNLGYEPLSESDIVKQYKSGGAIPKAVTGFEQFMSGGGGQAVSSLIGAGFSQLGGGAAAGSQIGSALGQGLSMIPGVGAVVGPALSALGGLAGAIIDAPGAKQEKMNKKKFKSNIDTIALQDSAGAALGNYSSFVRNGGNIPQAEVGWLSHDWQPQKIAYFGEHKMEDLLKPPADADMLRTGGNIRQNYLSELDNFNFGGSLKTHWGGRAEVDSYNPYLPGTGETVMFKGNQHSESDGKGRTGIGVSYGPQEHDSYTDYAEYGSEQAVKKAKVEVENREPAIQLPEPSPYSPMQNFASGGQANNNNYAMTVFGALEINEHAANEIGDKQAKGRTFKTYIAEINKKENEANNKLAKANEQLENLKVVTPFDRLKLNSLQATIQGENEKLKDYAVKKVTAAEVQNAYNETAEEYGIDADALASKGKIKPSKDMDKAKYGKEIDKAQKGKKKPLVLQSAQNAPIDPRDPLGLTAIFPEQETSSYVMSPYSRESFEENLREVAKGFEDYRKRKSVDAGLKADRPTDVTKSKSSSTKKDEKDKTDWKELAKLTSTQLANLLRRPLQEELSGDQLLGEMLAKAQNQLQPVQAQKYQPLLDTPFDVSFQDQLNQNQATFNALQRQIGANPAALSALAAQKYSADKQVLADQFRTNQALRAGVFSKNRDTLNDAALKNLAILDQQYVRQQEALSKTKATDLEIAKSISDKIAKNRLENRTFAAYSNMFPQYGFNRNMMAISQAPTFFNPGVVPGLSPEDAKDFQEWKDQKNKTKTQSSTTGKYGKNLKKHFQNGSIVKSLKNI